MIKDNLERAGISLPESPAPAGSYVPAVRTEKLLYISGQIPMKDGKILFEGKVSDKNVDSAQESARLCAVNIMAHIRGELGDLEKVTKIVSLTGFVNCVPEFTQHPKVINPASDLFVEIFGSKIGSHSRIAIGTSSLPFNAMTEIGAVVQVK